MIGTSVKVDGQVIVAFHRHALWHLPVIQPHTVKINLWLHAKNTLPYYLNQLLATRLAYSRPNRTQTELD